MIATLLAYFEKLEKFSERKLARICFCRVVAKKFETNF